MQERRVFHYYISFKCLNLSFIIIFQSGELTREQENELRKTFDDHDEDGSGAIDITEFERIAIDLGEPLSSEELQEIIKDLDKDGSGVVSYDEFIRWWRQT